MEADLIPELEEISVDPMKLILDPNNPRLITKSDDLKDPGSAVDLVAETTERMKSGDFHINEIRDSIKANGWIPIDYIFVRKIDGEDRYLVLEGNRRVTAVRSLLSEDDLKPELRKSLSEIQVMEIVDDLSESEIRKKITYLLGVRHHGALKKWSPFAQAHNIYKRYMEVIGQKEFSWNADVAERIASALSISVKEVQGRLRVYMAMKQISETDAIKNSDDPNVAMKDHYYSVCEEVVSNPKRYSSYIAQDQDGFGLDSESQQRMINLCHFDQPSRDGAPISNPQEWRKLHEILKDPDPEKRVEMLERVEVKKEKPSDVYAERSTELQKIQWDGWLREVHSKLKQVTIDDVDADGAKEVTDKLAGVLNELEKMEASI